MLTVAKITAGGASGYAEYLDGRSQPAELGDYYLKDGERVEAAGRWVAGAEALGCDSDRPVEGETLRALMAVRRPDTRTPLRRAGGNREAVAAIDATFSAPKSVSAVWALASPEMRDRVERVHELAVDRALAYATRMVAMVRERVDGSTVVHSRAREVIATSWRHTTARAVDGRAPDPQLHSHVLLHGAVRSDGQVVAIDSRAWLVHRRELGAAYRTELAHELSGLGFAIHRGTGRGGRYFELEGVPGELIDRWSSRHHQVKAAIEGRLEHKRAGLEASIAAGGQDAARAAAQLERLSRWARLAPGEDRAAGAFTRDRKRLMTRGDLDRQWVKAAREVAFDGQAVECLRSAARSLEPADDRELLDRLTEFDATFTERDARAVALEVSAGINVEQSLDRLQWLRSAGELLVLSDGRHTTRPHRCLERQTVSVAQRLAAARVTPIPPGRVAQQTTSLDVELQAAGGVLGAEQRAAVQLACRDRPLVLIQGQAGTGKSTALVGVARAHAAQGRQIIVTSTAALAAERLATELAAAGVNASSYSTAALQAALACGRVALDHHTTVIHDEAALASTREQHQLLTALEMARARLIEVGDPRQSHPVGASGLWPALEHAARDNQASVELSRNVRVRDPADRRDQQLFRDTQHQQAIRGYAHRGRVTLHGQQRQAEDHALEAAHTDRKMGRRTLVIAQTSNEHLDELNARAQAICHQHLELGQRSILVTGRPYQLHPGDQVQIRRSINHPELGQIRNGTTAQVVDIDPDRKLLKLRMLAGREVTLERGQLDRADIRLAYVQHPFPAQGHTTDTTHLIVAEHATQEGSYVALTRARQSTHIHASLELLDPDNEQDRLVALSEHMSRTEPDVPSISTPLAHETEILNQHARELNPDAPALHRSIDDPSPPRIEIPDDDRDALRSPRTRAIKPQHLTALLGPRPHATNPDQAIWEHAADAISQYRARYSIQTDDPVLLGATPAPGNFQQRYDRRQTAGLVLDALDKLDRPGFKRGLVDGRSRDFTSLTNDLASRDQTAGWEW